MTKEILFPRLVALNALFEVIGKKQNLDDVFDKQTNTLSAQDKAFVRMLVTTCLRRCGQIDKILNTLIEKPLPNKAKKVTDILRLAICQIEWMEVPPHAAVSTAVDLAKELKLDFYTKLINGVLRTFLRQKENLIKEDDFIFNTPKWLFDIWEASYAKENAFKICQANLTQPATFVSVKDDVILWEKKLKAKQTSTGSLELPANVYIPELEGFNEGAWWVQDAAAALPVLVFDDLKDKYVADFCAAPGGKTAALIVKGAKVYAFDISEKRMKRVEENLKRLNLTANLIVSDANKIENDKIYDAILIDAPCSATGTIRRHPDLYFHRTPEDIKKLNIAQLKLLKTAHKHLKENGTVVYCTCSLQKQEGEDIIEQVKDLFDIVPINDKRLDDFRTPEGFIRTFPYQNMDGFFIAKLKKKS